MGCSLQVANCFGAMTAVIQCCLLRKSARVQATDSLIKADTAQTLLTLSTDHSASAAAC